MENQSGTTSDSSIYTVEQYLFDSINFDLPEGAVKAALVGRGVDGSMVYADGADNCLLDLVKADLYKWMVLGPSKVDSVKDSDNGWSHSAGGYTLSKEDKKLLTAAANAIYEANGEEENIFGKKKVAVHSFGIMHTQFTPDGRPIPRIIGK